MTTRLVKFAKAIIIIALFMTVLLWWFDAIEKGNNTGHYEYSAELVDGNHYVWVSNN